MIKLKSKIDQRRHANSATINNVNQPEQEWINQLMYDTEIKKSKAADVDGDRVQSKKGKEKLKDQFSRFLGFGEHLTAQLLSGMATPPPNGNNKNSSIIRN